MFKRLRGWFAAMIVLATMMGAVFGSYGIMPFVGSGAAANVVPLTPLAMNAAGPIPYTGDTRVDVYRGLVRDGINSRMACGFLDGIANMRGELVDSVLIVTDPLNREYYRSQRISALDGYAVRSMTCLRSAQTGWLVVTIGGFIVDTGGQQPLTLATKYPIAQPVLYEHYRDLSAP